MEMVGSFLLGLTGAMIALDGALNLMGCGDRFEDKYRLGNWIEIVCGAFLLGVAVW